MKRNFISKSLFTSAIAILVFAFLSANCFFSGVTSAMPATLQGAAQQTQPCPQLPIRITVLGVAPSLPSAQYKVEIGWMAQTPQCFTMQNFVVRGTVTFTNGQARGFGGVVPGTQTSYQQQLSIPLSPGNRPKKVSVLVQGTAQRSLTGSDVFSSPPITISTTCPGIPLDLTQASFAGLQAAPQRPGEDFFPKVKTVWTVNNLPACFRIGSFVIDVEITAKGKTHTKSVTASAGEREKVVIIDSVAVGSGFTPDSIRAKIRAIGTARITGMDNRERAFN